MSEFQDRLHHFYRQTDGTLKFPNSLEGDMLRIAEKEVARLETLWKNQIETIKGFQSRIGELQEAATLGESGNDLIVLGENGELNSAGRALWDEIIKPESDG